MVNALIYNRLLQDNNTFITKKYCDDSILTDISI